MERSTRRRWVPPQHHGKQSNKKNVEVREVLVCFLVAVVLTRFLFFIFFGTNPSARRSEFLPFDLNHLGIMCVYLERTFLMFSTSIWNTHREQENNDVRIFSTSGLSRFFLKWAKNQWEKVFRSLGFLTGSSEVLYISQTACIRSILHTVVLCVLYKHTACFIYIGK